MSGRLLRRLSHMLNSRLRSCRLCRFPTQTYQQRLHQPKRKKDNIYKAPRDKFGAVAVLATIGVVGAVFCMVAVWAVIAHRNGRRPFACCGGRKKNNEVARGGSMDSEIPFAGAGRYFDRRPVSLQPHSFPMARLQGPQPAQCQKHRHSDADWVRVFKETN